LYKHYLHANIFKALDKEANENVDEFKKYADLWKQLFAEGMKLEEESDDIDYKIEDLSDQSTQLSKMKAELENTYGDYVGKLRYVTEQQKGIIDEIKVPTIA
jgi:hypothetical protein